MGIYEMLEDIRKRLERLEQRQPETNHSRESRKTWTSFERDQLTDDIKELTSKRAKMFGRSENSVIWEMSRIVKGMRV